MTKSLNSLFENLKADFSKITDEKWISQERPQEESPVSSYWNILKNKTHPAIIVKLKNAKQPASVTKADLKSKINPFESEFSLSKVKNIKHGGVLVGCSSKDDNARFKKIASEHLSDKYDVLEFKDVPTA